MKNLALLFCLLGLAARAADPAPAPAAATPDATAPAPKPATKEAKEKDPDATADAESRELKAHDVLRFRVEEDPSKSNSPILVQVTDLGDAHFPVSRGADTYVSINVRTKKLADIRKELKEKLDADFYQNATVTLDLDAIRPKNAPEADSTIAKAVIFGEMQGVMPISDTEDTMLSDAIIRLPKNEFANLKKVRVHRISPETKKPVTLTVDVEKILRTNDRKDDVKLLDGDRIEIVSRRIIF